MELIKVEYNKKNEQVVSARELHEFLEVKSRFNDWITNRIKKYEFIKNQDFVTFTRNLVNGGKEQDYIIKLDMAKELAMVENNDKGRQARIYFIKCKTILKGTTNQPIQQKLRSRRSPQELLADNAIALDKMFSTIGFDIPKKEIVLSAIIGTEKTTGYSFPEIKDSLDKVHYSSREILNEFNVKKNRENETLILLGLQQRSIAKIQKFTLTKKGKEYGVEKCCATNNGQGFEIEWKESVKDYIKENIQFIPVEFITTK